MTGGSDNGDLLAWAVWLVIVGGGASGLFYALDRWHEHLPRRVREWLNQPGDL